MCKNRDRIFTKTLLAVYCLLLVWIVLLKIGAPADLRYLACERSINLVPFHYDVETGTHFGEVLLNVLVFIPFGLLLGMLGIRAWKAILLGSALSLTFEALQYVLSIGASDVTDLIMNTVGTAIGVFSYLLLCRIFKRKERLDRTLNAAACAGIVLFAGFVALLLIANR